MIQRERVKALNAKPVAGGAYVLYWMQASIRSEYNHALEYAIREASEPRQPVVVYFGLIEEFPEANARHYYFLLEGLRDAQFGPAAEGPEAGSPQGAAATVLGAVIWRPPLTMSWSNHQI